MSRPNPFELLTQYDEELEKLGLGLSITEVFFIALASKQTEIAEALIDEGKREVLDNLLDYDNYALRTAAKNNYSSLFKKLLAMPNIREKAQANNNEALIRTAENGQESEALALLEIPAVRENAHAQNNLALVFAAKNGCLKLFFELMTIPLVKERAPLNQQILRMSAVNGRLEIVMELLKMDEIKKNLSKDNNAIFRECIKNGQGALALKFLSFKEVQEKAATVNNEALTFAVLSANLELVLELLKIDIVRNNAHLHDNWALVAAADQGDLRILQALLKIEKVKENAHKLKNMALTQAVKKGHLAIVQELLKVEVVRKSAHQDDNKVLKGAIKNGQLDIVMELLKLEKISESRPFIQRTAFILAAALGKFEALRTLYPFEPVEKDIALILNEALVEAARNGHVEMVQELLKMQAQLAKEESAHLAHSDALIVAATKGHSKIVLELLKNRSIRESAHLKENKAFIEAIRSGCFESIEALLKLEGVQKDADAQFNAALRIATILGYSEVFQALLKLESVHKTLYADIDKSLLWAAEYGLEAIFSELLKAKNFRHSTLAAALGVAAQCNRLNIVQMLLKIREIGSALSAWDPAYLISAARYAHVKVVQALLQVKEIADKADACDNAALLGAVGRGKVETVKTLLAIEQVKKKAIAKKLDVRVLIIQGDMKILAELLKIDAVKIEINEEGESALTCAVAEGRLDIVQALLHNKTVENYAHRSSPYGDSPSLSLAVRKGDVAIALALLKVAKIREQANADHLMIAVQVGHLMMARTLLKIKKIHDTADVYNNFILDSAIDQNHVELVLELLKVKKVREGAALESQAFLHKTIQKNAVGAPAIVEALLALPGIQEKANAFDNEALVWAICSGHFNIAKSLLGLGPVVAALNAATVMKLLTQAASFTLPLLNDLLYALGRQTFDDIESLKKLDTKVLSETVEKQLKDSFFLEFPQGFARAILVAQEEYQQKSLEFGFNELAGNAESAMDDKLLRENNEFFTKEIYPALEPAFSALGQSFDERLDAAELKIRALLLQQIKARAECEQDKPLLEFIESSQEKIFSDKTLAAKARTLFISNTIPAQVAWRCYDQDALNVGWENLLVPPPKEAEDSKIFTTQAASEQALTLKEGSDRVRELAAYCMLAIEHEPNLEKRKAMEMDLSYYLCEIKRAHNSNIDQADNPSCFPGTLSRLYAVFAKSSRFFKSERKQMVLESLLREAIKETLLECFTKDFFNSSRLFQKAASFKAWCEEFSDALTGLNENNALSFLCGNKRIYAGYDASGSPYTKVHSEARALFFQLMIEKMSKKELNGPKSKKPIDEIVLRLEKDLLTRNEKWFITPADRAYIKLFMLSLADPAFLNFLGETFAKLFPPEEQLNCLAIETTPFEGRLKYLSFLGMTSRGQQVLEKKQKVLEEQDRLFKKIKAALLKDNPDLRFKSYLNEELEKLINELTTIPAQLRVKVLSAYEASLKLNTREESAAKDILPFKAAIKPSLKTTPSLFAELFPLPNKGQENSLEERSKSEKKALAEDRQEEKNEAVELRKIVACYLPILAQYPLLTEERMGLIIAVFKAEYSFACYEPVEEDFKPMTKCSY